MTPIAAAQSQASLFLVEDDASFRETFADVAGLRGSAVSWAATGEEAERKLCELRPSVIISDVLLPDIHGLELCRRIRRMPALKKTPIVLISASALYNDPRDRAEGFLAGASVFLSKSISAERFWKEIDGLLTDQRSS